MSTLHVYAIIDVHQNRHIYLSMNMNKMLIDTMRLFQIPHYIIKPLILMVLLFKNSIKPNSSIAKFLNFHVLIYEEIYVCMNTLNICTFVPYSLRIYTIHFKRNTPSCAIPNIFPIPLRYVYHINPDLSIAKRFKTFEYLSINNVTEIYIYHL